MKRNLFLLILFTALHNGAFAAEGSSARGGGNTLNGLPIESYARDPQTLPAFKSIVKPILDEIYRKLPEYGNPLRRTFTDKVWFFVPVRLDQLASKVTGIPFNSDQTIIQTTSAVWVYDPGFKAIQSRQTQATLLFHEAVLNTLNGCNSTEADKHDTTRFLTVKLMKLAKTGTGADLARVINQRAWCSLGELTPKLDPAQYDTTLKAMATALAGAQDSISVGDGDPKYCNGSFNYDPSSATIHAKFGTGDSSSVQEFQIGGTPEIIDTASITGSVANNFGYGLRAYETAVATIGSTRRRVEVFYVPFGNDIYVEYNWTYEICRADSDSGCHWDFMSSDEVSAHHLIFARCTPRGYYEAPGPYGRYTRGLEPRNYVESN